MDPPAPPPHDPVPAAPRFCYSCEAPVPPRGRHCPSCRVCVLGRDHHCTLLGQCVGHRNRRYFLALLLHGAAALLYCSLLHAHLLLGALRQGPPLRAAALLLAPWLLLLSGKALRPVEGWGVPWALGHPRASCAPA